MNIRFGDLRVGATFDFIAPNFHNSFWLRCTKMGPRAYRDSDGVDHTVGSTSAIVYHVEAPKKEGS